MTEHEVWCPSCNGTENTCDDCDGTGYVIVVGEAACAPMAHGCTGAPHRPDCEHKGG